MSAVSRAVCLDALQLERLFRTESLVASPQRRGMAERITPEAWEGLQAEMRAGHIGGLHEAQAYLRDTWHIAYGIDAISKLFRRRKTKLKTGRPRHCNSPAEQAAFKK
jgi:transposase